MHNSDAQTHTFTHFLTRENCQRHVRCWLRIIQARISLIFPVFVLNTLWANLYWNPFRLSRIRRPNTRHSLAVSLVISDRVITPINFQNPLLKHVLFADPVFGKTARDSHASCRKYDSAWNCLTQAEVAADRISLVNPMTTFADILTCAIFFHAVCWGATGAAALQASCFFPHTALQSSDWTVGGPMGSRAAGYLNSPHIASTKPDNIPWLFKHYPLRGVCHQQVCSVTAAAKEQGKLLNPFFFLF